MIIEVAATAGGGKTTFSAAFHEQLAARGTPLRHAAFNHFAGAGVARLRSTARQPRLAYELFSHLPTKRTGGVGRAFNLLRRSEAMREVEGPVLIDSGIVFGLSRTLDFSTSTAARLAPLVARPDLVLDLRLDPSEAAQRARNREDGRSHPLIRSLDDDALAAFMVDSRRTLTEVIDALQQLDVEVLAIPYDDRSAEDAAAEAIELLDRRGSFGR